MWKFRFGNDFGFYGCFIGDRYPMYRWILLGFDDFECKTRRLLPLTVERLIPFVEL